VTNHIRKAGNSEVKKLIGNKLTHTLGNDTSAVVNLWSIHHSLFQYRTISTWACSIGGVVWCNSFI